MYAPDPPDRTDETTTRELSKRLTVKTRGNIVPRLLTDIPASTPAHLERVSYKVADGVLLSNQCRTIHQGAADLRVPGVRTPPEQHPSKDAHYALAHAHTLIELRVVLYD